MLPTPVQARRRDFLRTALGGSVLSLSYSSLLPTASGQASALSSTQLADGIFLITGAGCNVLAASGPDGALMVDGGSAAHTTDLMKLVADLTKQPMVAAAFNTHWHYENTGSNEVLRKAGAKLIAHENTKLWLGAEVYVDWQKMNYDPRPKDALPNQTFYTNGKMSWGGESIEYGYLPQAHTDSDIYILLKNANILMAGDVVSGGRYPVLDPVTGGWINGMVDAQKLLLGLVNEQTRIIPGSGPTLTKADLQAEYDMLSAVRTKLLDLFRKGVGPKEMVTAAPTKEYDAKWGNPEQFILNAYRGLWGHVRDIGGIV